jgi:hypothetical protein
MATPLLLIEYLCRHLRRFQKYHSVISLMGWLLILFCVWMFILPAWGFYPKPDVFIING